jgi:hypothetical protein
VDPLTADLPPRGGEMVLAEEQLEFAGSLIPKPGWRRSGRRFLSRHPCRWETVSPAIRPRGRHGMLARVTPSGAGS